MNILIVDDSPSMRKLYSAYLQSYFEDIGLFNIKTASDPNEAIEIIKDTPYQFNFIISDFKMKVEATVLFHYLLENNLENTSVLCVSGEEKEITSNKCMEFKNVIVLEKPISKQELITNLLNF